MRRIRHRVRYRPQPPGHPRFSTFPKADVREASLQRSPPRKVSDLRLQPWEAEHGAKAKDAQERRLHSLVCHGKLDLTDAQRSGSAWRRTGKRPRRSTRGNDEKVAACRSGRRRT